MAFSWILGGKKKEEKQAPVIEAVEVGSDEGYTIIQANTPQVGGLYPQIPSSAYSTNPYTPLPYYPVLPQRGNQQTADTNARTQVQNQLDGIPFVLNPALEQSSKQTHLAGLEDLRRAVFQIAADINDSAYSYDFKTEYNIMREASAYHES